MVHSHYCNLKYYPEFWQLKIGSRYDLQINENQLNVGSYRTQLQEFVISDEIFGYLEAIFSAVDIKPKTAILTASHALHKEYCNNGRDEFTFLKSTKDST